MDPARPSARRFAAAAIALLVATTALSGCMPENPCPSDVCTDGTVKLARGTGPNALWVVTGDDGETYDLVRGLPPIFRHEGMRVRMVAEKRKAREGHGVGRAVHARRLEAPGKTPPAPAR